MQIIHLHSYCTCAAMMKPVRDLEYNVTLTPTDELKPSQGFTVSCVASRCVYYHCVAVEIPSVRFFTPTDNEVLLLFHLNPNLRGPELFIHLEMQTNIISSSLRTLSKVCFSIDDCSSRARPCRFIGCSAPCHYESWIAPGWSSCPAIQIWSAMVLLDRVDQRIVQSCIHPILTDCSQKQLFRVNY